MGVLHHTEGPIENLKKLSNLLANGGLIRLGLYSTLARKDISDIRKKFSKNLSFADLSSNQIRFLRQKIIDENKKDSLSFFSSTDFYSISGVKDLIFHNYENTFDLVQINDFLQALDFEFCGFESKKIINNFKSEGFSEHDIFDLKKWNKFENKFPKSFFGMYQFWIRKK